MGQMITFAQAVNQALYQAMELDENVICFGLGVDDPKGVFGTTLGLQETFGHQRVFDLPASENAMTGMAVGAALNGIRPVMTHQRLDFFLLAMDQLVNNAAKWHYMFGGQSPVPITIRLILGRGWGQGPTHSQNLQAWFAHIPGLKVVMPATPRDAKGLLLESIFDDNPVLFLEHRWLHQTQGEVPEDPYGIELGKARWLREGGDLTLVASSYMTVEALGAWKILARNKIACDLIDLRSISPLDMEMVQTSVEKTGRLLVLDTGAARGSVAAEIIARIAMDGYNHLKAPPRRLGLPHVPTPTSFHLTRHFYRTRRDIVMAAQEMTNTFFTLPREAESQPHDVPGPWFKGPF